MFAAAALASLMGLAARAQQPAEPPVLPPGAELSQPLRKALRQVQREAYLVPLGRHLWAVTADVPVMETGRKQGLPVTLDPGERPVLVVDRERAGSLSLLDFETLFVRARWLAASGMTLELRDAEMAARQSVLDYLLQKAGARPSFAAELRESTRRAREEMEARRRLYAKVDPLSDGARLLFPGSRPERALAAAGFDLYEFSEDPYLFYETAVEAAGLSPEAVGLDELSDFLKLHGDGLSRLTFAAGGRLVLADGRMYPGRLGRAARRVKDQEGLQRLREGLGLFRTTGQEELLRRVNRWVREGKP
jgi:hypothetical protein